MLFMVIERFKGGDPKQVGERFAARGRMLPDDVTYLSSWVETSGARCFQLVEAPTPEALSSWISSWDDLIDFEIVAVVESSSFWRSRVAR